MQHRNEAVKNTKGTAQGTPFAVVVQQGGNIFATAAVFISIQGDLPDTENTGNYRLQFIA